MKTKVISTLKKELLIIELPEQWEIIPHDNGIMAVNDSVLQWEIEGSYTLLGSPDEISEEYARELVEEITHSYSDGSNTQTSFLYYKSENTKKISVVNTALESFHSALESEIFWNVNPIPTPETQGGYDDYGNFHGGWDDSWISAFDEAQEKTFDRKRTLIFAKN